MGLNMHLKWNEQNRNRKPRVSMRVFILKPWVRPIQIWVYWNYCTPKVVCKLRDNDTWLPGTARPRTSHCRSEWSHWCARLDARAWRWKWCWRATSSLPCSDRRWKWRSRHLWTPRECNSSALRARPSTRPRRTPLCGSEFSNRL